MYKFEHENGRFYHIYVQADLFSQHTLVIARGGVKASRQCVIRKYGYPDEGSLQLALRRLIQRRRRHGYRLV